MNRLLIILLVALFALLPTVALAPSIFKKRVEANFILVTQVNADYSLIPTGMKGRLPSWYSETKHA